MPRIAEWFHRLSSIEEQLQAISPDTLVDRNAIENIFQVSKRQASRILYRFGAETAGGAYVIQCGELLSRVKVLGKEEDVIFERRRRERLDVKLEALRQEIRSRRIVIAAPQRSLVNLGLAGLPEQISLTSGELHVQFSTPADLLEKLMLLGQTISNDWEQFEKQAGAAPH